MHQQAENILNRWVEGINSKDLEGVLSMYDASAILLPTFSSEIRSDLDGIRSYFRRLAKSDKIVVSVDENSTVIQQLANTVCSLAGLYTWDIQYEGSCQSFVARYTFTLDVAADKPILHHHSSLLPES